MLKKNNLFLLLAGFLILSMSSCHRGYGCPNTVSISDAFNYVTNLF